MKILIVSCRELPFESEGEHLLVDALRELGSEVSVKAWEDISPNDTFDLCVFRTVWDYSDRIDEFMPWLESMEKAKFKVINPVKLVKWNLKKNYLLELKESGVGLPNTYVWQGQYLPNWSVLEEALGPAPFVFKPLVSAGAKETFLVQGDVSYSAAIDRMQKKPFIAQNYIREVKQGEISAILFGGKFSHAVKKIPQPGDFRVQAQYGGSVQAFKMNDELINWAESVISNVPDEPLIARVDFVLSNNQPLLMELELFEPELFFNFRPESAMVLAKMMLTNNS